MQSWENPKGRTAGRHTTAVELKDGSILALGGKNSDIDGYMPQAITRDGGDTYTVSKTPFPALNSDSVLVSSGCSPADSSCAETIR